MTAYDIIKRPIITEQSMADTEMKRYTFEVAKSANKIEIAKAVEQIFGVKVAKGIRPAESRSFSAGWSTGCRLQDRKSACG